jgi:hypothetical protein
MLNKGGQRMNKHAKFWVKNAFDEWKLFCDFHAIKSIADIFFK